MPFGQLLLKAKCYIMMAALVAGTGWYKLNLDKKIKAQETTITEQKASIQNLSDIRDKLMFTIDERNREVMEWKGVSEKLEENQAALMGRLGDIRRTTTNAVAKILEEVGPETCEKSIDYLVNSAGELKKW